jgi:hypothetical protein
MTPLGDMSALSDCHLLCRVPTDAAAATAAAPATAVSSEHPVEGGSAADGGTAAEHLVDVTDTAYSGVRDGDDALVTKQYRYTLGEAIVFGDGFEHATETGVAAQPLAFLCFTFGDRHCTPEQWAAAEAYISEQGPVYQDPAGRLVGAIAETLR